MKTAVSLVAAASVCALALPAQAQLLVHKELSYAMVKQIAEGAIESCAAKGFHVSVTIVNRDGEVLAQIRGDDVAPHTVENSLRKAYTANTLRAPSEQFAKELAAPNSSGAFQRSTIRGMIGIAGGLPIKIGNETIGAVGVSGSPNGNDTPCAQTGIDRVAADLR
jgi:uncharacterized protein GlcG (DUF336 family)